MKFKSSFLHLVIFFGWMVLSLKLFTLHNFKNEKLDQRIESQFASKVTVKARRGDILDKHGRVIATSVLVPSAFIDPKVEKLSPYKIKKIAKILNLNHKKLSKKLKKNTRFVWLKRKLSESTYKDLKKLDFKGLGFVDEYKRVYPYKDTLGFLIGSVDIDDKGISGLELIYDKTLAGQAVKKKALRDGKGRLVLFSDYELYNELKGQNISTAIDIDLQLFMAQELKTRLVEVDAKRAWAATMDIKTGEIVAQAQTGKTQKNKNILTSEVHEQGSVLKTFSFLKAIEKLDLKPSDEVECFKKGFKIGRRTIRNSHKEDCEKISLVSAFAKSLNTVSADLALKLGEKDLIKDYKKRGFDKKTGIDFPGEAKPIFHTKLSGKHQLASMSFGHGLALSSIQLLKAYATLFNESSNLKPSYLLKEGNEYIAVDSKKSFLTKGLLSSVVSKEGTALKAKVNHYLVGGKTGTAQKPDLENGGYSKEVLSTFIGVYPLTKPRYVTLVSFDESQELRSGGAISAPVFSKLAGFLLRKEQIMPDRLNLDSIEDFNAILGRVEDVKKKSFVEGEVPDLKGLSLREAMDFAKVHKLKMKFNGSGKVHKVSPKPGAILPESRELKLALKPL